MATRTFKFYGKAFTTGGPVTVSLNFNNQPVFTGAVSASTGATPGNNNEGLSELFTFEADTSVYGDIPLTLTVTGGDLFYGRITANYGGDVYTVDPSRLPDRNNPDSIPAGPIFSADDPGRTFVTASVDNYVPVDYNVTDGRENVQINGVAVPDKNPTDPAQVGRWQYLITNESTLTCTQKVVRALPIE
jgi:hypothetical protein